MSANNLDAKVRELRELKLMIEKLEAEVESIKDAIKEEMVEQGVEVLVGTDWKASWKNVTSSRFDTKAFRAENPELATKYIRKSTSTRFIVC